MVPIVLLRGLLRESGHWHYFIKAIKQRYPDIKILTPNVPGNGDLNQLKSPTSIDAMMRAVQTQIPEHYDSFHLVSISMGSMIASHWAHQRPDLVKSLTMINPSFSRYSSIQQRINLAALSQLFCAKQKSPLIFEQEVIKWTSPNSLNDNEKIEYYAELARQHPVTTMNTLRQLLAAAKFKGETHAPECPTQVIVSEQDKLVNSISGKKIADAWNIELSCFNSNAHDLPLAEPHELAEKLLNWLYKTN